MILLMAENLHLRSLPHYLQGFKKIPGRFLAGFLSYQQYNSMVLIEQISNLHVNLDIGPWSTPHRKQRFIGIPDPKKGMVSGTQPTILKRLFQLDDEPNLYIGIGCFTIHPF